MGGILNIPLLREPLNWGIVLALLTLTGYGLLMVIENGKGSCGCNEMETM